MGKRSCSFYGFRQVAPGIFVDTTLQGETEKCCGIISTGGEEFCPCTVVGADPSKCSLYSAQKLEEFKDMNAQVFPIETVSAENPTKVPRPISFWQWSRMVAAGNANKEPGGLKRF